MHAVILAGGRGVRLRPYTTRLPKPLVPIGNEYSILEIVLHQLAHHRFTDVTIALGHLGHLIRSFVGDGGRYGLRVTYAQEELPLGTMGPVVGLREHLPDHVLVMNGDILTDLPYGDLLTRHAEAGAPLTVATYTRRVPLDFGVMDVEGGRIAGFREKPSLDVRVSMGVYALSTAALEPYPPGVPFGFDDLVLDLLARSTPPYSYPFEGYWLDIGRPDDYDRANAEFAGRREQLLPGRAAPAAPLGLADVVRAT